MSELLCPGLVFFFHPVRWEGTREELFRFHQTEIPRPRPSKGCPMDYPDYPTLLRDLGPWGTRWMVQV